jgi:hypothetical protein
MTEAAECSLMEGGVAVAVGDRTIAEPRRFRPQASNVLVEEPAA